MIRFISITILILGNIYFNDSKLQVKKVLIREIDIGEYNNLKPLSEIILLLNNNKAVFLRDSINNLVLGSERQRKIKSILDLGSFEKIDVNKLVKRTTDYEIKKDSLKIYYMPDNDKSAYFNGFFKPNAKDYNAILYMKMNGEIHEVLEILEDKVKIHAFKVYSYN